MKYRKTAVVIMLCLVFLASLFPQASSASAIGESTIEFDVVMDSGVYAYWLFDSDADPYIRTPGSLCYYAADWVVWNQAPEGNGNCILGCDPRTCDDAGSGVLSSSTCTAENTYVLSGTTGVTIEIDDLQLTSLQKRNWGVLGQSGDRRDYTGGTAEIKVSGTPMLTVIDVRLTSDVNWPAPAGPGYSAVGSGWGTIDVEHSHPDWINEFDNGSGQVKFSFTMTGTPSHCWDAYNVHLTIQGADHEEVTVSHDIHGPGYYDFSPTGVSLNVTSIAVCDEEYNLNSFTVIQVMDFGGTPPDGIDHFITYCYWELGTVLCSINTSATFDFSGIPEATEVDPYDIRILKRTDPTKNWEIYPDYTLVDSTHIRANNLTSFSQFALGIVRKTVSIPIWPTNAASVTRSQSFTLTVGGAICDDGCNIQYRADWGDGSYSDWTLPVASWPNSGWVSLPGHTYYSAGTYDVRAQARSAVDIGEVSYWSAVKSVDVVSIPIQNRRIDFDIRIDGGGRGPFMFNDVYAYNKLLWNPDGRGNGNCDSTGSGLASFGDCTYAFNHVVTDTEKTAIEIDNFALYSFEKVNEEVPGEGGDRRIYIGGTAVITDDGTPKLKLTDCQITLDVTWPEPYGSGMSVNGSGRGTIDLTSDPAWKDDFDSGNGQVEFEFSAMNPVVQNCWGAYETHLTIKPSNYREETQGLTVNNNGPLNFPKTKTLLNIKSFTKGGLNQDLGNFMINKVGKDPGGTPPSGITKVIPYCYWELGTVLDSVTTDVTFDFSGLPGIDSPVNLRILKRENAGSLWEVYADSTLIDSTHIRANNVTDFSDFGLGEYDTQQVPVTANVTGPPDGEWYSNEDDILGLSEITGTVSYDSLVTDLAENCTSFSLYSKGMDLYWNGVSWQPDVYWLAANVTAFSGYTPDEPVTGDWVSIDALPVWSQDVYSIVVRVTDTVGTVYTCDVSGFIYDYGDPAVTVLSFDDNSTWWLRGGMEYQLKWLADDETGIRDTVRLSFFDGTDYSLISEYEQNDGIYDWIVPVVNVDNAHIMVEVEDGAGMAWYGRSNSFGIDSTAPEISIDDIPGPVSSKTVVRGCCVDPDTLPWPYREEFTRGQVKIKLCNDENNTCWNESGWGTEETWLDGYTKITVENLGSMSVSGNYSAMWIFPLPQLENGSSYTVTSVVPDFVGNIAMAQEQFICQESLPGILGDVNGDGVVNVLDVTEIIRIILQLPPYDF